MILRTLDYRRVKKLVAWQPIISNKIIYLIDEGPNEDIGLWSLHKHLKGLMIHADMTLKCRGKRAVESAVNAFKWIFKNTDNKIIYAEISVENRTASYIAIASGMKFTHHNNEDRFYEVKP